MSQTLVNLRSTFQVIHSLFHFHKVLGIRMRYISWNSFKVYLFVVISSLLKFNVNFLEFAVESLLIVLAEFVNNLLRFLCMVECFLEIPNSFTHTFSSIISTSIPVISNPEISQHFKVVGVIYQYIGKVLLSICLEASVSL